MRHQQVQSPSSRRGRSTLALLGVMTAAMLACARQERAALPTNNGGAEPATPVTLSDVTDTTVMQPIVATGVLGAKEEIPLGFKIGGVIARILVDAGEPVKAGQLLAVLEQPEIGAEVARAEAAAGQAERDYARASALYRDSVISRDRYEAAGTGAEVARASLRIARFNEQYAAIRAPGAGVILRRLAEPGQQIANGTAVLVIGTRTRGQVVRVGLADREMGRVRIGDRATIRLGDVEGGMTTGRVRQIAAAATPGTGTWEVEVQLLQPIALGSGVASGLIVNVAIEPRERTLARLVPIASLVEGDGDSAVVYSVAPGSETGQEDQGKPAIARRHRVRVAFLDGDRAAIASGLDGVTRVITAGVGYLRDSVPVVVTPPSIGDVAGGPGGAR